MEQSTGKTRSYESRSETLEDEKEKTREKPGSVLHIEQGLCHWKATRIDSPACFSVFRLLFSHVEFCNENSPDIAVVHSRLTGARGLVRQKLSKRASFVRRRRNENSRRSFSHSISRIRTEYKLCERAKPERWRIETRRLRKAVGLAPSLVPNYSRAKRNVTRYMKKNLLFFCN